MGTVRVTHKLTRWVDAKEVNADLAVLQMVTDIDRVAKMLAPKDKRTLVNSARIDRVGTAHYRVIFGGGGVRYARRRHFENKRNPQTLRYLERAGDGVARNLGRYTRGI